MPSPPTSQASSQAQSSKPLDYSKSNPSTKKPPPPARPSSSVLLISPQNTILLLHRVAQSSSFASAHVFPGGNLDDFHDGTTPEIGDVKRHEDSLSYRVAAIRETFEESGILLALKRGTQSQESPGQSHELLQLSNTELAEGRKLVHSKQVKFLEWLESKNGVPDTAPLIPFTRWVTPPNLPKRFSTQMYIYFLPLEAKAGPEAALAQSAQESTIPIPTHDGGIEHTAARFAPAHTWLDAARAGKIVLFPPQFFLLHLVSDFFTVSDPSTPRTKEILQQQRDKLKEFIYNTSDPPWPEKVMSPIQQKMHHDGRSVLALDKPGKELEGTGRSGDKERVVLVEFAKGGPKRVEVAWRKDVLEESNKSEKGKL